MIYQVEMSKGPNIKIDDADLAHLQKNIGEALIRVKQGIINPSFMVSIIPTDEKETKMVPKIDYQGGNGAPILVGTEEVKTLADKMSIKNNLKRLP